MANLNKVFLIGNLTRDPELRYIPSGSAVTTFTVAVNRVYTQQGEKKEEVSYIKVVVWAKMAEICGEYLSKGSPVFVEGRIQSRSWETPQGEKRSAVEVIAERVQFLGKNKVSKPEGGTETAEPADTQTSGSSGEDAPF
jgi:single-strand DNA-binding protein